jgi:hypothetical protein
MQAEPQGSQASAQVIMEQSTPQSVFFLVGLDFELRASHLQSRFEPHCQSTLLWLFQR